MLKLILSNIKNNIKKHIAVITAVMAAILFGLAAESIFSTYCEVKVGNAYSYSGKWDYRINYCETEPTDVPEEIDKIGYTENQYTAILEPIPDNDRTGIYAGIVDNYMFSIIGIDEDTYGVIGEELVEGEYPNTEDELLVPDIYKYNGQYVKIGDVITLKVTERRDAKGNITQTKELSEDDTYTDIGEKKYTVCGMYSTSDFTMGTYLFNAYTGKSGKPTRSYYYRGGTHSQFEYERIWDVLKDKYEERAEGNSYVNISILSVYESDYFKAISKGIDVFQIIIIVIALAVVFLNLFQITESQKRNIKQLYTLGASGKQLITVYGTGLLLCEFIGIIFGAFAEVILMTAGKKSLLRMLNSNYSDFSFVDVSVGKLFIIYGIISVATIIFVSLRLRDVLRVVPKKKIDRTRKAVCHNILELSYNNVRNRALFNIVLTSSVFLLIFMTTIVISIHPGMVAKSEINTGMYSKHGHYYMLIDKDLTPYMDELESIDGLDRIKFDIYNNIRLEACKETSFYLQSCNRESYEQLKQENSHMVDYEEFQKGGYVYLLDDCLSNEGEYYRVTNLRQGDSVKYYYKKQPETKYSETITAIIGHKELEKGIETATLLVSKDNLLKDDAENADYYYRYYCDSEKIKQVGAALRVFSKKHNIGFADTAEIYSLSQDNHNVQIFAITVISGLFIIIGIAGMITAVRLDRISRGKEFTLYRTLGMDVKVLRTMQFFEYLSIWLTSFVMVLLMLMIGSYTILKDLISYYDVDFRNMIFNMIKISVGVLVVLFVIAFTAKDKGGAYRD